MQQVSSQGRARGENAGEAADGSGAKRRGAEGVGEVARYLAAAAAGGGRLVQRWDHHADASRVTRAPQVPDVLAGKALPARAASLTGISI